MNKVQQFLISVGKAFNPEKESSWETTSNRELAATTRLVKRRPQMIDRIVFLEDSNPFDVAFCKIALDKMFRSSFFSICEVRDCINLLKLSQNDTGKTLNRLQMIHCVHWSQMDPALRERIPGMISEVMTEGAYSENLDTVVSSQ